MLVVKIFALLALFIASLHAYSPYVKPSLMHKISAKYKTFATRRFMLQQKVLDKAHSKSELEKLKIVNDFYNKVRYASDMKVYHKRDYWATPWQFLGKDRGDCEDYVISKYFALVYLGIKPEKLFFTYVKSTKFKAAHMVLTYFATPHSEPLVLDSYNLKIFPASKRKDLIPVYNFNGATLYKATTSGRKGKKVHNTKANKKWTDLQKRMQKEEI